MLPSVEQINSWSPAWASLMLAVIWQSVVLAALIAGVALLLRRASPGLRYWLWQIVAVKLLLMPFWTVAVWLPLPGGQGETRATAGGEAPRLEAAGGLTVPQLPGGAADGPAAPTRAAPPADPPWLSRVSWQSWLLLAWAAIVLWQVARLLRQRRRLKRLLREAKPVGWAVPTKPVAVGWALPANPGAAIGWAPLTEPHDHVEDGGQSPPYGSLPTLLHDLAGRIGLRRPPVTLLTDADCSPFACGLRRPTLVLPRSLLAALDEPQWRQVLLHELAHVKRRDLFWGFIPEIARIVYFFHPVVHWVCYRIRLERELACDQAAMAHSGHGPAAYAQTLAHVVGHASQPAILKAAASSAVGLDGESGTAGGANTKTQAL